MARKPTTNPMLTPEVETALRGLSKNALLDCLADMLGLVSGNVDDPPELSEVAELLNPRLRLRGDRLLRVPSPELKPVAEPFAGLETCVPDFDTDPLRQDRYPAADRDWEPCFLCDRPVVTDRPHVRVETLAGAEVVAQDTRPADLEEHPDYSGTYAVGPRCAKRLGARWKLRVS